MPGIMATAIMRRNASDDEARARRLEAAMLEAAQKARTEGITDPVEVRALILEARAKAAEA
jgi:hypothetical protein